MSNSKGSEKQTTNAEMNSIISAASDDGKKALVKILALERDHLPQKNPKPAKLGREIAEIIRGVVP